MPAAVDVVVVDASAVRALVPGLADLLMDAVQGGASVSFMAALEHEAALRFWEGVADEVVAGRRRLLVARAADGGVVGAVQVILVQTPNQPHRAEIAKFLVLRSHRRMGVGELLMRRAEAVAAEEGRSLLTLDAMTDGDAARLYERLGWRLAGIIPDYALFPDGRLGDTSFYWKAVRPTARRPYLERLPD